MSQITTHVLDTMRGRPARGVSVVLQERLGGRWKDMAQGRTDADGRVSDLLPAGRKLRKGTYRMLFDTGAYFKAAKIKSFYPCVAVYFDVEKGHYHVPLLLSPFGYSTYRGS